MDERQYERLLRRQRLGKLKFIILYGILGWGITAALLVTLITFLFNGPYTIESLLAAYSSKRFIFRLGIFMIGGILFGWWAWLANERKLREKKD